MALAAARFFVPRFSDGDQLSVQEWLWRNGNRLAGHLLLKALRESLEIPSHSPPLLFGEVKLGQHACSSYALSNCSEDVSIQRDRARRGGLKFVNAFSKISRLSL